jgi:L-lysine 6-transaminase
MSEAVRAEAKEVRQRLSRHILADGLPLVLDLARSRGSQLVDAVTGDAYLDMYTFFASAPLGINPPEFTEDPRFLAELAQAALNKPANPDVYSVEYADFVETFARVLGDPDLPHLFFVEGGALAVENALKCAFDWKSRHNEACGRAPALGTRVLHLTRAFHGRSGYTLSLTNTDPAKTDRFPRFDWPRIDVPAVRYPLAQHAEEVELAERRALAQAEAAFSMHPHDIACFIAEPIQGEGGDNHMRAEFLLAMQELCHRHDALFVMDEVQTGAGATGSAWAYQQFGLAPDVVAFGKKVQLGGIMAGRRVTEVPDNVFTVSSRISSTWGGGLVDMVRCRKTLEVIERDGLIRRAGVLGENMLDLLRGLCERHPDLVSNARGRGLLCAFDAADPELQTQIILRMREDERVLVLPCGVSSVRLRPALNVAEEDLEAVAAAFDRVLERIAHERAARWSDPLTCTTP